MMSGNSLVGTHVMSATLRQLGSQVELVYNNLDFPCLIIHIQEIIFI